VFKSFRKEVNQSTGAWWVFVGIVIILNIPNTIPWERSIYPAAYIIDLQERLIKCAILASLFLSFFSRPWLAWLTGWCLFIWWMPISFATRWLSEAPITGNLVGIALASSPGELMNLAGSIPSIFFPIFLSWNIFCGTIFFFLKSKNEWYWDLGRRIKIFLSCSLLLLVPYIFFGKNWSQSSPATKSSQITSLFVEGDREIGSDADLPRAFPYELPLAIAQYWQARRVVSSARASLKPLPDLETLALGPNAPDVVVLVIGESSSRSSWHLFNPSRLAKTQGLYPFSNVVAQSTATRQAVPSLLTPQPLLWPDGLPNANATESIISLVSKSGYKSAWLSNQAAIGQFDGIIAAYADEATVQAFLNPSSFFQQGTHDEVLLPALRRQLSKPTKSFIVLHTMGSHFKFEHRYPPGFGIFSTPSDSNQAYQNSIAYTDKILENIIEILEDDSRSAVMLYISDHGQDLPGGRCGKEHVNRVTTDSYEIPALVWLSQSYAQAHPLVPEALRKNAKLPYTAGAVYQTLIDLLTGEVKQDAVTEGPASLLRSTSLAAPQIVASSTQSWVNYRDAAIRSPCFIK
jgi:glucan phosphoethanolaminetransferase (alkaline phosphatase superfamily)